MRSRKLAYLLPLLAATLAWPARADLYVVVHESNPVRTLTRKQVLDLYMGHSRSFANGDYALAFDLPRDHALRTSFYAALAGMTPAQLNTYWSRLMFSGKTMPPQPLPSETTMLDVVKRNPDAIGYLGQEPGDPGVRVVLVLKETR
jgi:hypothetical protein